MLPQRGILSRASTPTHYKPTDCDSHNRASVYIGIGFGVVGYTTSVPPPLQQPSDSPDLCCHQYPLLLLWLLGKWVVEWLPPPTNWNIMNIPGEFKPFCKYICPNGTSETVKVENLHEKCVSSSTKLSKRQAATPLATKFFDCEFAVSNAPINYSPAKSTKQQYMVRSQKWVQFPRRAWRRNKLKLYLITGRQQLPEKIDLSPK